MACIERLSQLIESLHLSGRWKVVPLTRGGTRVSHLMFANDVVVFGEANKEQAQVVKECLAEFCEWSGQKVSTQKSSIYFSPNINEAVAVEVCNTLGIQRTEDFG